MPAVRPGLVLGTSGKFPFAPVVRAAGLTIIPAVTNPSQGAYARYPVTP